MKLLGPSECTRDIRGVDAKDDSVLAGHMTDDVRLRLGDAETFEDESANHRNQAMTTRPTGRNSRAIGPKDNEGDPQ